MLFIYLLFGYSLMSSNYPEINRVFNLKWLYENKEVSS